MSRLGSIKITIMELNGYFYCGKCSLLSGSLWKMFCSSASTDLSESLHNGNASSISSHLARQATSQCMHGCLLTVGFPLVLLWALHLQGGRGHFIPGKSPFPSLKTEQLFMFLASCHCSSVEHLLVQWWREHILLFRAMLVSWELRNIFHLLSETEVLPFTLHSCFVAVFFFLQWFLLVWIKKQFNLRKKFLVARKDLEWRETHEARNDIQWWWTLRNTCNHPTCAHTEVQR